MTRISARKKVYGFILVLFVLTASAHLVYEHFLSGTGVQADTAKSESEDSDSIPVELAEVTVGEISSYLTATANLRALREVDIVAQTEARVQTVSVEEGDSVQEGQILCRLDDTELQIQLQSSRQKLAQAELQKEKSKIRQQKASSQIRNSGDELARYEKLYAEKLVSEREVAQLRYRLDELLHDERVLSHEIDELTHRVDELKAAIAEAEFRISQSRIRAPFVGVITERKVEAGQTVKNLEKLFKLSSFSTLFADVFLSEGEARTVDEGQETTITLAVQDTVSEKGRVARISPIVDQATGTIKITVELENHSSKFKPGAFVRVDIETDKHTGSPLVPKRALVEQDGRHYVFVAEGDTVSRVEVKTGFESESQTEILKGVHAGTRVVVAGHGNLKDGSKVKGVDKG